MKDLRLRESQSSDGNAEFRTRVHLVAFSQASAKKSTADPPSGGGTLSQLSTATRITSTWPDSLFWLDFYAGGTLRLLVPADTLEE